MKLVVILTLLCIGSVDLIKAQESGANQITFGAHVIQFQNDFGYGVNLKSPAFFNRRLAIRLRGNMLFHEHEKNLQAESTRYWNSKIGVTGIAAKIHERIRIYGEGGFIMIFPANVSINNPEFGGYGHYGFEFVAGDSKKISYYFEIGSSSTGSRDKVVDRPANASSLTFGSGIRYRF